MELKVCLCFKISIKTYLNGSEKYEVLSRFLASNSADGTAFEKRVTYDTVYSYVNHFLRTGNCLPQKHGGANYVVVSDWIQAITLCDLLPRFFCIDSTLLCEFESSKI